MEIFKLINGQPVKLITYEDLREIALQNGIEDSKIVIGLWAKQNGYIKTKKMINNKSFTAYYKI